MTQHVAKNDNRVKIRELVDRQVQAWEKHDFGIAAPDWLPSGQLISPGGQVSAEKMQSAMAGYFKPFRDLRITVKNDYSLSILPTVQETRFSTTR